MNEIAKPILKVSEFIELAREIEANILLLETPRNTGKSTSALELCFLENQQGRKFAWIRNQKQQAEAISRNFMDRYSEAGYKLKEKDGALINSANETCGHFLNVSGRIARSGDVFNDQRLGIKTDLIIYDEYNELESIETKLFERTVQLIESIQRDNPNAMLVLIGNRDKPNNPFLHKFGLKPEMDFKTSKYQQISGQFGKALICRIGIDEYRIFRPAKSISAFLSEFDSNLSRYIIDGGYLDLGLENVLNFKNWIEPTFNPLVKLAVNGIEYALGQFKHYDKGDQFALCKNYTGELDCLAFDSWSDVLKTNAGRASTKSIELFTKLIFDGYKSRELFFDEFETLEEFARLFRLIK